MIEAVINSYEPEKITAIDQSEGFVAKAQKLLGSLAHCKVGNALALPLGDSSVDITVSGLVLNFISEPEGALVEMRRVTAPGGTVALYIWDYAGKMDFLNHFWDVAIELNPKASELHNGYRFLNTNAAALKDLYSRVGFEEITITFIEIETQFRDFDDYLNPFLGVQGPAPTYATSLSKLKRSNLRDALRERLPFQADGSISIYARAWAVSSQL